jgi:hypothetical protein
LQILHLRDGARSRFLPRPASRQQVAIPAQRQRQSARTFRDAVTSTIELNQDLGTRALALTDGAAARAVLDNLSSTIPVQPTRRLARAAIV